MKRILAVITLLMFVGATHLAIAKGTGVGASGTGTGAHKSSPKKRLKLQHKRIKQGVKNGTITPAQHKQLAQEGKSINQERKADLAKDGGKLTTQDRQTLEKEENQRSKEIYTDKHPAGTGSSTGSTGTNTTTGQ